MIRVGIVNDLAVACEALRRTIASDPALSVAWIARDGAQAVELARGDRPDVVLMDLVMPVMDGVESTRRIMRECPCPILVVTATVSGNAGLVYEALGAGALDAVNTPSFGAGGAVGGGQDLLRRIHRIGRAHRDAAATGPAARPSAANADDARAHAASPSSRTPRASRSSSSSATSSSSSPSSTSSISSSSSSSSSSPTSPSSPPPPPASAEGAPNRPSPSTRNAAPSAVSPGFPAILAIGASTGGPRAIARVLASLPRDLPVATLVVQHVSAEFVDGFAAWLAAELGRPVGLARAGLRPRAGDILVAGEDRHLAWNDDGTLEYRDEPSASLHRPSVDELFASLAGSRARGVAVLLTGMGRDGAAGLLRLKDAGWHTIAQDEPTSVVWGMPGVAHRTGAAVETLPVDAIGRAVVAAFGRIGGAGRGESPARPAHGHRDGDRSTP